MSKGIFKLRAVVRSLREYQNNRGDSWSGKKTEIEELILKRMPSDESRYGNSETMERNDKNWRRRSRETVKKEKIENLSVSVHAISVISSCN